jgi:hypothetical protein
MRGDRNYYTLYWRDGEHEIVRGRDITHAMSRAGYGGGAIAALDFFGHGKHPEYYWNADLAKWEALLNP